MLTGRATRSAERAIRSMLRWGRNKRGVTSGPKYACLGINIFSVDARVGTTDLQTFKDVGAVVKARARWVEVERSIRFNLRRGPSAVWRKVHVEHMICRDLSNLSGCRV